MIPLLLLGAGIVLLTSPGWFAAEATVGLVLTIIMGAALLFNLVILGIASATVAKASKGRPRLR